MMLKYFLIRLLPILLLVVLGYSFFMPSTGERQFLRTEAALNNAQSFRMELTGHDKATAAYNLLEVACPDREHTIVRTTFLDPNSQPYPETERIIIGGAEYLKSPSTGTWSAPGISGRRAVGCAGAPSPVQAEPWPAFKVIRAMAHIEKGKMDEVSGEPCRQWNVTFHQPNGTDKSFDYCINPDDNLPRRIRTAENSMQVVLTNWNKPLPIEVPAELRQ
jgi:hypothetical protein